MPVDEFVSLKELAHSLGIDKTSVRRWAHKRGFIPHRRRTRDSGPNRTDCFTKEEAERIIALRREDGFVGGAEVKPISEEKGYFYVIQLVPEFDGNRVKLGFASNVKDRLQQHRTAAPTATMLKAWPCRRTWEVTAIAAITAVGCRLIINEVFDCDDVQKLLERGDAFFAMLPDPGSLTPLAARSPLNQPAINSTASCDSECPKGDDWGQKAAELGAAADGAPRRRRH